MMILQIFEESDKIYYCKTANLTICNDLFTKGYDSNSKCANHYNEFTLITEDSIKISKGGFYHNDYKVHHFGPYQVKYFNKKNKNENYLRNYPFITYGQMENDKMLFKYNCDTHSTPIENDLKKYKLLTRFIAVNNKCNEKNIPKNYTIDKTQKIINQIIYDIREKHKNLRNITKMFIHEDNLIIHIDLVCAINDIDLSNIFLAVVKLFTTDHDVKFISSIIVSDYLPMMFISYEIKFLINNLS